MTLKRHFKNHSVIHTFKQFKIKNKSLFLINNLQLVEHSDIFQKIEDDILFEQHLQRIYIKVLFSNSNSNQIRTKTAKNMFQ